MNEKEKKPQNKIRELRKEKGLSIDKLAQKIGVSRATINNYETGTHEPKFETWQQLADYFGVTVPYLQGISDDKNNEYKKVSKLINDLNQDTINNGDVLNSIYKEVPKFDNLNDLAIFYMQLWKLLNQRLKLSDSKTIYTMLVKKQDNKFQEYLNDFSLSDEEFNAKLKEQTDGLTKKYENESELYKNWQRIITTIYEAESVDGRLDEFNAMLESVMNVANALSLNDKKMLDDSKNQFIRAVDSAYENKRIPVHGPKGITYVQNQNDMNTGNL